ncbi:phosphatidylinositol-specific phospholipase C/glycerophosphodiester phosphodiesterase family protein [Streptomyces sp. Pv4-95]|uniref:phosphatidylinositol-specific phospholipase C/glycerophosphodiester phosphodiesterase family protein n=1 Tax=Streptomyces sp. Pv4-95 TaxID=3049543 RepID=UPI003891F991
MNLHTRRTVVVSIASALAAGLPAPAVARDRGAAAAAGTTPLRLAHAHNDYAHPRPLLDALDHGFGSVEADIWLVGGHLLVAHEQSDLDPARTLESLYLDPLRRRIHANGGSVYRGHRLSLQLLIDIKTAGAATYRALARVLHRYRDLLSGCTAGRVHGGPVTAVVSGDRAARAPMEAERVRHAFYDGRPEDLGAAAPASFLPLVSVSWTDTFRWQGAGPMPQDERARLRQLAAAAHAERRRLRFWATPDTAGPEREAVWRALLDAGVDHLNSDDLPGLASFLRATG